MHISHAAEQQLGNPELAKQCETLVTKLSAFVAKDMAMLEINPLVVTRTGQLKVLDAKVSFDDNALFRHPDVVALRDGRKDPKEIRSLQMGLNCSPRSTGPSAAWSASRPRHGDDGHHQALAESPANFLDVGGGHRRRR